MTGHLLTNTLHFARLLRTAGLPVSTDRLILAARALPQTGLRERELVRATLACTLVQHHDDLALFNAAFDLYWRAAEQIPISIMPSSDGQNEQTSALERKLNQAVAQAAKTTRHSDNPAPQDQESVGIYSDSEKLREQDFDTMSEREIALLGKLIGHCDAPVKRVVSRRQQRARSGNLHLGDSLRKMIKQPDLILPQYRRHLKHPPPIVVLIDVSRSMQRYALAFLYYAHGLTQQNRHVKTLVFGTRLTHVSRELAQRDPDIAVEAARQRVRDWGGGTRIASNLARFNRLWARRLLGGNAAVILVTDGLDQDKDGQLGHQAAKLKFFAHELIWLNPLLRFQGFEPRASGIRAILPHADRFLPMHNLDSLAQLAATLKRASHRRRPTPRPLANKQSGDLLA